MRTLGTTVLVLTFLLSKLIAAQEEVSQADQEAQLLIMLDELLYRADDARADELQKSILKTSDLGWLELRDLMRRPMPRSAMPTGLIEKKRLLGQEGVSYQTFVKVPENYDPTKFWPLLITVHGTGGEGLGPLEAMSGEGTRRGMIIGSVSEAPKRQGKGWGYSAEERQVLTDFIRELKSEYQIDCRRVYMNGWSRGGHASWDIALRYPSLLAGIGPIVGAVPSRDLALCPNLLGLRIDAVNGALDQAELVAAMEDLRGRLTDLGANFRSLMDPQRGHEDFSDRLAPMMEFLAERRRPLSPGHLALSSYEKILARHDWLEIATFDSKLYEPGQKITIPGLSKMDAAQRRVAWLAHIEEHTARLEAQVEEGNKIILKSHKVRRARILLPPEGIDLDSPIEIWCEGKRLKRSQPKPSAKQLLRSLAASRDPFAAYPAQLELSLP